VRNLKKKDAEILVLGCGMSSVPRELVRTGFRNVTCLDWSETVIKTMEEASSDLQLDWVVMDARKMDIPTRSCDLVFDKALMDSICMRDDAVQSIGELISEVHRVLRVGGIYLIVSHGSPGTRIPHFEACEEPWCLVENIPLHVAPPTEDGEKEGEQDGEKDEGERVYYLYVMQKIKN